jgi:hypothetical protein
MNTAKFFAGAVASILLLAGAFGVADAKRDDCDAVAASVRAEIASACPCDAASGRTGHVRCVTKKLRDLSNCKKDAGGSKACGPVPKPCLGAIRRVASHSTCGVPDLVTCCMPHQQDCRNDPNPGDGKAEGTCGRSKKACDVLSDCVVAKCQPATSAGRCVAVGGTVGKSNDCNTACTP